MKKVFAILLVLAVAAGFVFAATTDTETHSLKVKTIVKEKLPAFQLRFIGETITANDDGSYTIGAEDGATVSTNDTTETKGVTFANGKSYTDSADPLYVGFDLGTTGNKTATFFAYLVQNGEGYYAKTNKDFILTFSDGEFDDLYVRNAKLTGTEGEPTSIVATATTANLTTGGSVTASDEALIVDFNGDTCPESAVQLGYAVYTWAGIPNLDMGEYTADVLLTVTTTY